MERDKNSHEFISIVSHELRTPLTSIHGALGLIQGGAAGKLSPQVKELIEIAYRNSRQALLLIDDLLDVEQIEADQMKFDIQEESLNNLVQQAVELNRIYGEQNGAKFVIKLLEQDTMIGVDANRLLQVLSNLLSNAAKFSSPGDEVMVSVNKQNGRVRVAVEDHGHGIAEEFKPRIFSKFARMDSVTTRQKNGSGLGLYIAKKIIDQLGGRIGFDTKTGATSGTTFWFELSELT